MLKLVFLVSILITLALNLALTYYLIRNKRWMHSDYKHNKEIVSFNLLPQDEGKGEAAVTEVLETEALGFSNRRNR